MRQRNPRLIWIQSHGCLYSFCTEPPEGEDPEDGDLDCSLHEIEINLDSEAKIKLFYGPVTSAKERDDLREQDAEWNRKNGRPADVADQILESIRDSLMNQDTKERGSDEKTPSNKGKVK